MIVLFLLEERNRWILVYRSDGKNEVSTVPSDS